MKSVPNRSRDRRTKVTAPRRPSSAQSEAYEQAQATVELTQTGRATWVWSEELLRDVPSRRNGDHTRIGRAFPLPPKQPGEGWALVKPTPQGYKIAARKVGEEVVVTDEDLVRRIAWHDAYDLIPQEVIQADIRRSQSQVSGSAPEQVSGPVPDAAKPEVA